MRYVRMDGCLLISPNLVCSRGAGGAGDGTGRLFQQNPMPRTLARGLMLVTFNLLCSPNQANGAKFSTFVTRNAYVHALSHTPIKCESYLDVKSVMGFGFPSA